MLDNLLGNIGKSQDEITARLKSIEIKEDIDNGAISLVMNAAKEITELQISEDLLKPEHKEQLEDLLLELLNRGLSKAAIEEQNVSQEQIKNLIPPGMESMFGL